MTPEPWLVYETLVGDAAVLQIRAGSNGAREIVAEVGPVPAAEPVPPGHVGRAQGWASGSWIRNGSVASCG